MTNRFGCVCLRLRLRLAKLVSACPHRLGRRLRARRFDGCRCCLGFCRCRLASGTFTASPAAATFPRAIDPAAFELSTAMPADDACALERGATELSIARLESSVAALATDKHLAEWPTAL